MASDLGLPLHDLRHAGALVGTDAWGTLDGARVLVTGGTGFVGKWLLATALHATRAVGVTTEFIVVSRRPEAFSTTYPQLAGAAGVTLLSGDVRDVDLPSRGVTHVVHGATDVVSQSTPLETFDVLVSGTRRVLECALANGADDLLLVSSGAVYGPQPATMATIPETYSGAPAPWSTASGYGEGKRVSEWLTHLYASEGLAPRIARCFAFVGPYLALDKQFAIGNFIADAMARRPIEVQGDGTTVRSYLHAADLSGWLWALMLRGATGSTYNVGGAEPVTMSDLARRVNAALGSTAGVRIARDDSGVPSTRYVPDVTSIRRDLALADPIPLDDAVARTAAWHRERSVS